MSLFIDLLGNSDKATITVTGLLSTDTVSVSDGTHTHSGTWSSPNWVVENINHYGTHTVSATRSSRTETAPVNIVGPEQYEISMEFFTTSITVTGLSSTDTVSASDGTHTYSGTWNGTNWIINDIHYKGTYTVSATRDSRVITKAVSIISSTSYSVAMEFFTASVTVTGLLSTDTVSASDGTHTYSGTWNGSAWLISNIYYSGTYTVSATRDSRVTTKSVSVTSSTSYSIAMEFFTASVTVAGLSSTDTVSATKNGSSAAINWNSSTSTWQITNITEACTVIVYAKRGISETKSATVSVNSSTDFNTSISFDTSYDSGALTSSGTWTCPFTAYYDIEIHGGGGGGGNGYYYITSSRRATGGGGGGSGEKYSKVALTGNQGYAFTIGSAGSAGSQGGTSTFGSYSLAGGGAGGSASNSTGGTAGASSGSLASNGTDGSKVSSGSGGSGGSGGATTGSYGTGGAGGGSTISNTGGGSGTAGMIRITFAGYY